MKKIIILFLIKINLYSFSLEESLLKSENIGKEITIKKEYYKEENQKTYKSRISKITIINKTNNESIVRIKKNIENKKIVDILIKPYKKEEIELEIGNYNISMFYSEQRKKFINFEKKFGKDTLKKEKSILISLKKVNTFKHLCKGVFKEKTNIETNKPSHEKAYNMVRTTKKRIFGECIENQKIVISDNKK